MPGEVAEPTSLEVFKSMQDLLIRNYAFKVADALGWPLKIHFTLLGLLFPPVWKDNSLRWNGSLAWMLVWHNTTAVPIPALAQCHSLSSVLKQMLHFKQRGDPSCGHFRTWMYVSMLYWTGSYAGSLCPAKLQHNCPSFYHLLFAPAAACSAWECFWRPQRGCTQRTVLLHLSRGDLTSGSKCNLRSML